MKHTNELIHATSPYLLQHAHNPVNWRHWSEKLLTIAEKENKLVLISIGYSACHWCHVMEHESFEDQEVASVMNENFVCIKVDREERPDVDNYYMTAVQLMGQQGGWPLNVIALPNGKPIWGGTYFPKDLWLKNILAVANYFETHPEKVSEYAQQLDEGIAQASFIVAEVVDDVSFDDILFEGVKKWDPYFDFEKGGRAGAPKFPMPVNLDFILYWAYMKSDKKLLDYVHTTLEKMAQGGIYDQVGGGFARYSVDEDWKVPHFEKMLHDNGQLLSLYSKAYLQYKNPEFRRVVYETVDYLEQEMLDVSGAFYSALDADSEGVEGKYYVWTEKELQGILGKEYLLFAEFYNVNGKGYWEQGNYILLRNMSEEEFAAKHKIGSEEFKQMVGRWKYQLQKTREKRVKPGLDDKTLTSWNALVIKGLTDAYVAFKDEHFLNLAINNARFIRQNLFDDSGILYHSWKNGKKSIEGFLEDYALYIQACISLFEANGNPEWLNMANSMTSSAIDRFYNTDDAMFYFAHKKNKSVVQNHYQNQDNVIPASNSVMANNLHRLYLLHGNTTYRETAIEMLKRIVSGFRDHPMAYSNWGTLMLKFSLPFFEVAICGINSKLLLKRMQNTFLPQVLWAVCDEKSDVPVLQNRFRLDKDLIYVCKNSVCELPVEKVEVALAKISI